MSNVGGRSRAARGLYAEGLAADHLRSQGYRIVTTRHRCRGGEVDIIAYDGNVLCFVEVRSHSRESLGDPLESIDRRKVARIARAARDYLTGLDGPWPPMRFDAVGVMLTTPPEIRLVKGAFET